MTNIYILSDKKTFSGMPLFASNIPMHIQALALNTFYQFHLKKDFKKNLAEFGNREKNLYAHF